MIKSRYFIGIENDPSAKSTSIKCHKDIHTFRLSAYFKVDANPIIGKEGYIFNIEEVLHLKIRQEAGGTTKLVFYMNDADDDEELAMTIQKHKWVLVVINIDGEGVYMSVKDDPSDYKA